MFAPVVGPATDPLDDIDPVLAEVDPADKDMPDDVVVIDVAPMLV
jgi:hypothetical protein